MNQSKIDVFIYLCRPFDILSTFNFPFHHFKEWISEIHLYKIRLWLNENNDDDLMIMFPKQLMKAFIQKILYFSWYTVWDKAK